MHPKWPAGSTGMVRTDSVLAEYLCGCNSSCLMYLPNLQRKLWRLSQLTIMSLLEKEVVTTEYCEKDGGEDLIVTH